MARKKLLYIGGGILVVLLLILLILPMFLDANQYRPRIEAAMSDALNRKVSIGNISLSILSGGVSVENLSVADDPAFSNDPFLQARTVTIGVELMPLIFSRELRVTGLTIDQPPGGLLHNAAREPGTSQPSGAGNSARTTAASQTSTAPQQRGGCPFRPAVELEEWQGDCRHDRRKFQNPSIRSGESDSFRPLLHHAISL